MKSKNARTAFCALSWPLAPGIVVRVPGSRVAVGCGVAVGAALLPHAAANPTTAERHATTPRGVAGPRLPGGTCDTGRALLQRPPLGGSRLRRPGRRRGAVEIEV